jgi:hypothetical protein
MIPSCGLSPVPFPTTPGDSVIARVLSHRNGIRRDNPVHATRVWGSRERRRLRGSHVVRATRMSAARTARYTAISSIAACRPGQSSRPATSTSAGSA